MSSSFEEKAGSFRRSSLLLCNLVAMFVDALCTTFVGFSRSRNRDHRSVSVEADSRGSDGVDCAACWHARQGRRVQDREQASAGEGELENAYRRRAMSAGEGVRVHVVDRGPKALGRRAAEAEATRRVDRSACRPGRDRRRDAREDEQTDDAREVPVRESRIRLQRRRVQRRVASESTDVYG
jgi:hypothetical protein